MVRFRSRLALAALLSVALPMLETAHAQSDGVFLELRDRGVVRWDATGRFWVPVDSTLKEPLVIRGTNLVISERFYSKGRDVIVAAQFLEMTPQSLISTGYTNDKGSAYGCSENGDAGGRGGNLRVVANVIRSIAFATDGQKGGDASDGCRGASGESSYQPSGNGGNATCVQGNARKGKDSTVPSGDSSTPGTGRTGGSGGNGGDGGTVALIFATFGSTHSISTKGGGAGRLGTGGPPGYPGQPGPLGEEGRGIDDCSTTHCNSKNDLCEPTTPTSALGGKPGPLGKRTTGRSGDNGQPGRAGRDGAITRTQQTDAQVTELVAQYLKP
jgi:hypothetical protein